MLGQGRTSFLWGKIMKIKTTLGVLALLATTAPAYAQEAQTSNAFGALSGTMGFVTDYRFRGVTQSDESPAVQGSIDWSHDSGLYAGVWGSNVDFNDGDEAHIETDIYGGYKFEYAGLSVDAGVIWYVYPSASNALDYDYIEGKLGLGYDFGIANVSGAVYYSPDFFGGIDDAVYTNLGFSAPVMDTGLTLLGSAGYQWFDNPASEDYIDWSLGLGYNWQGFDFALKYVDTDLDKVSCPDGCSATGIFSISKAFN